jgi:hypothetical protein
VLDVERWAEIRRLRFVERLSIREIARRTGHDRKTVQRAIRSERPPRYERAPRGSKLDPFKDEVERLLERDPRLPALDTPSLRGGPDEQPCEELHLAQLGMDSEHALANAGVDAFMCLGDLAYGMPFARYGRSPTG